MTLEVGGLCLASKLWHCIWLRCGLKNFFFAQDTDTIIKHIQKSTRELEQGPVGRNLSSAEKRKFLVNTVCTLFAKKHCMYTAHMYSLINIAYYVSNVEDTHDNNVLTISEL
jgi:hypothetical protein